MTVLHIPLYQFLEGTGKTFVIPVYQRDYAWKKANCEKLWYDISDLIQNKHQNHFLGTLVTVGQGFQEYSIIDGQQRLTTITILLVAIANYLSNKTDKSDQEKNIQETVDYFLINKNSMDKSKRIRLKPNKQDKIRFEELFENKNINKDNITSNIVSNYGFFIQRIESSNYSVQNIYEAFLKLTIVSINLDNKQDDPQLIFESLNATGVNLTAGDLIRNYILMDLEPDKQEMFYEKYWLKIENNTGDIANFVKHYLDYKLEVSIKEEDIYLKFKIFAKETHQDDKEKILLDLLDYSNLYACFIQNNNYSNNKINTCLGRLHKLESTVVYPYLFNLFTDFENNNIDQETVLRVFASIESYIFRKIMVGGSTMGFNKFFITLSKEIKKEVEWKNKYLDIINFIIVEQKLSRIIPDDGDFMKALTTKDIYKYNSKNKNFLLESLENYNTAYPIDLESLTIEHIIPQTLTPSWKIRLGQNYEETHKKYLHTLGNLTLTASNPQLSNYDYDQKQKIDYQISKLKLNQKLDSDSSWSESEIINRSEELAKEAISIWPYPTTNYKKIVEDEQIFDLSMEENYSYTKPNFVIFNEGEKRVEVSSWQGFLVTISKFLYDYSPTEFNNIVKNLEFLATSNTQIAIRKPLQITNNIIIESNLSANRVMTNINRLCIALNYPRENIQFTLK